LWNRKGDYRASLPAYEKLREIALGLAAEHRRPAAEKSGVSLAETKLGETYLRIDRGPEALDHLHRALAADKELAEIDRNNFSVARKVFLDYLFLGMLFSRNAGKALPEASEADADMRAGIEIAERLAAADPANTTRLMDLTQAHGGYATWLRETGKPEAGLVEYRKMNAAVDKLWAASPTSLNLDAAFQAHQRTALCLTDLNQLDEALGELRRAEEALTGIEKAGPLMTRTAKRRTEWLSARAGVYLKQQRWEEALADYRGAAEIPARLFAQEPGSVENLLAEAEAYQQMAECYAGEGRREQAAGSMEKAIELYGEAAALRPLAKEEEAARQADLGKLAGWRR
jgi:tetratricopeptide (TPR) repeat protein